MTGEREFEHAAKLAELERAAGVARVQSALAGPAGRFFCECGERISDARRQAMPNAASCIDCAHIGDRRRRRA